jgi:hypothetical protein
MAVEQTVTLPDANAIRQDLEYMTRRWGELDTPAVFEVRAFKNGAPKVAKFSPDWMDEAVEWVTQLNELGHNLYVVRNPVRHDLTGSASDKDILASFFLWADCDDPASAGNVYRFDGPKWNAAVTTGRTPSVRVHTYWELEQPCTDLADWTAMQRTIAAHFGSDGTVVNPSRIMRVGGTVSYPDDRKQQRGYIKEVCTIRTAYDEARPPVTIAQMRRVFGATAPAASPLSTTLHIDTGPQPLDRERLKIQALSGQEWHHAVIRLVASYVSRGLSDAEIHALTDPLTLPGYTVDQTRAEVQTAIDGARRKGWTPQEDGTPRPQAPQIITDFRIKSSDEFLADLKPLEYLINGILPTGVVYSLTGYPGHGKTTLALQFGLSVALGEAFAEREVTQGDVLILAGENPYNLKWQYAAALAARNIKTAPRMHFVEGHFSISGMLETLRQKMTELPELKLVIIDSLQAFFEGEDDNANIKMVEAARGFREIGNIESKPGILVIAHPAGKEPRKDNLVPRGGGAFLAEIDGNLTVWSEDGDGQTLHHSPKFRGAGFDPIDFVMATHEFDHLTDTNGTPLKLKVSRTAFVFEQVTRADRHDRALRQLLMELSGNPRMSIRELATKIGASKSSASRMIAEAQDEKLIKRHAKGWKVTDGGEEYLGIDS